ncbi:hypothetical protein M9458_032951 [Cirrhinus mrigala]|uniref:DUF3528 domain-containing protein n=1 Tax=Cirrhinus mrigala TaxID=683832 RepID=A0ABD0PFU8_CIRMR
MDLHVSSRLKISARRICFKATEAEAVLYYDARHVMMDFDERVPVGSNMYLPGCTYYVLPPFLPQTPSSCPMTYSYSTEVSFRDYAIDTGNLPHCYATEDMVHRDCLSNPGTLGDMLSKNNSVLYHSNTSHTSNVYGSVGRNGVLPQAFDQFFETAYGSAENQPSEHPVDRATSKAPPPAETGSDSCRGTDETERCEETSSPEPSSGNNEEKFSGSSSTY